MTDTPNFSSILDEAPTEVAVVPVLPQGTWNLVVKSWEQVTSSRKGTMGIKFTFTTQSAGSDVDEDELADGDFTGKSISHTFWDSEYFAANLDQFHQACGIDLSVANSRRNRNDEVINLLVGAFIKHSPSQDGTRIRAEISKFVEAE